MLIENKYSNLYHRIVESRKKRSADDKYVVHHIIPKSLGGSNEQDNLVYLTDREHYLCHKLLVKFTVGKSKNKMAFALWRMSNDGSIRTSRDHDSARKLFCKHIKKYNSRPKTEAEKIAMCGERPHVNQTGKNNNNWKGSYITPWGVFDSINEASNNSPINMTIPYISSICKDNMRTVKKKNKYHLQVGKTYRELGFSFMEK